MKAKIIYIAQHPDEPYNCEVSLTDMEGCWETIHPNQHSNEKAYVPYRKYVLIPVDENLI